MLERLRPPSVLVLLASMTVFALWIFLPAEPAKAPESQSPETETVNAADAQTAAVGVNVASGFQDQKTVDAYGATALAFMPDGRLLVTNRAGQVLVRKEGQTNTTSALDIRNDVCDNSERGLLGLAVDPNFETNNFVYLFYTYKKHNACPVKQAESNLNPVNRVSRFRMVGDDIVRSSEDVLIDGVPSPNGNHNAGDLHFGNDGTLFVSTGDGGCDYAEPANCQPDNDSSRDRHSLVAKILRINPNGTIPDTNPYESSGNICGEQGGDARTAPGNNCKETYAMGFRNPFRFAIDPDASVNSLRVDDVGGARIEEVSQVTSGGDYGWNCREGTLVLNTSAPCPGNDMTGPIYQYNHNTGCSSITGGAFVPNGAGWPSSYRDAYLFGDYVCGKIFVLRPNDRGGVSSTLFANGLQGGPVSFAFGPDGALYYTTYAGGGQVRRVVFTANKAPVADVKATPTDPDTGKIFGPAPLPVNFDASGTTDDENDPLTYKWDFTDDGMVDQTTEAPNASTSHTYDTAGKYTAAVTASDDNGNSDTVKVDVYAGNTAAPQPVIESPVPDATFEVGQQIDLSGSAMDYDDGELTGESLTWEVIRHHTAPNTHTHTLDKFTGPTASFEGPAPEDLRSTNPQGNYLEIRLTATDSQGLSKTVSINLRPETTGVRFMTRPSEFYVTVNGMRVRAPRTLLSWEGYNLNVYAPAQTHDGRRYFFRDWSDGGASRHTIVTPQDGTGYTARFERR